MPTAPATAMAKAVGLALARLEPLIVEAGTGPQDIRLPGAGTLVGRSVIISTGTRTLQDQLFRRDVPLLAKAWAAAKIALLKGRANYLADIGWNWPPNRGPYWGASAALRARWRAFRDGPRRPRRAICPNSPTCRNSRRCGRRSPRPRKLPWVGVPGVFALSCVRGAAQCPGPDIVVVNHHLLLADLALQGRGLR